MTKKIPAPTLLAGAYKTPVVSVVLTPETPAETPKTTLAPIAVEPPGQWYREVLNRYDCAPDRRNWLAEQIEAAISWGGDNNMLQVPQSLLLAMLKDLKK